MAEGTRTERAIPEKTTEFNLYMRDGGWWVAKTERTLLVHHTDWEEADRERVRIEHEHRYEGLVPFSEAPCSCGHTAEQHLAMSARSTCPCGCAT